MRMPSRHQALLDFLRSCGGSERREMARAQSLLRNRLPTVRRHIASMDQMAVLFINTNSKAVTPFCAAYVWASTLVWL